MTVHCPTCGTPIPPELILHERQSELAKRKRGKHTRPGAKGLVRHQKAKVLAPCAGCHAPLGARERRIPCPHCGTRNRKPKETK